MEHVTIAVLEAGLDKIKASPSDRGRVELIARRPATGEREVVAEATVDQVVGLVGDNWSTRGARSTADGSADPDAQLTLMNARTAMLVAADPDRRALCGDQLYLDFDLTGVNVPPGTRLRIGSAVVEITSLPHLGCGKFIKRFGVEAGKWVNSPAGRELNLRGVNARVISGGAVRVGDAVVKV
jgi:hypothetical protein